MPLPNAALRCEDMKQGATTTVLSPSVTYLCWKVHRDWVTQLNYYDSIKAVIFASSHKSTALVMEPVFRTHKGVKAFAFNKKHDLFVTGGGDRVVRLWIPSLPSQCTGMLRSHTAPIFYLHISGEDAKIFSMMSTVETAKVWDFETGKQLFEFISAHWAAITCLTLDSSGKSYISFYISYISVGIIAGACSKEYCI
ncbi:WD repeat-containing protein 64-like [Theristicus caerulescens]